MLTELMFNGSGGGKEITNLVAGTSSLTVPSDCKEGILIATIYANSTSGEINFTITGCTAEQIGEHFGTNGVSTYGKIFKITNITSQTINIKASQNARYASTGLIY